ncbi:MAG: BrnT family toxin [Chloroflexi bacterium]|nr:BrnT family toxin [Chloroflexota bacterium]
MKIAGFIWLEDVVEKLEVKHNVLPEEVEEVFADKPKVKKMRRGHFRGEDVYRALGQTEAGRYLVVFFVYKLTRQALILSARDMDKKERRSYAN